MAAVLLSAGAKGKRFALPNSRIVIHQPLMSGLGGQATDIDIAAREILRMRERLNDILVYHTGQPLKRIQDERGRDAGEWYSFDFDPASPRPTPETGMRYGPIPPGRYKVTATNHDRVSASQDVTVAGEESMTVTLRFGK